MPRGGEDARPATGAIDRRLAILGIRKSERFPLVVYREDCADMAIGPERIDPALMARTRSLVVTGTHLRHARTEAAVRRAIEPARAGGAMIALDIDFRPNLWGLGGHGAGDARVAANAEVTRRIARHLHLLDPVVGTEEEFHIAGGDACTRRALRAVRAATDAVLICKRGSKGAVAITGGVPDRIEDAQGDAGFDVEGFNVPGAGDGFLAGLVMGWLAGEPWTAALRRANACGALAAIRHGCTPAYPSARELRRFLDHGTATPAVRHDAALERLHRTTTRAPLDGDLRIFAFDHRARSEAMEGATPERIGRFKALCLDAVAGVARGRPGHGIPCDDRRRRGALHRAAGQGLWIGRPCERPGARPLELDPAPGPDCGGLADWPSGQVAKALVFAHPDDPAPVREAQAAALRRLFASARRNRLEFVLRAIPSKAGEGERETTARMVDRFSDEGLRPDWRKLEAHPDDEAWHASCEAIGARDPDMRGIVVLGLDALGAAFGAASGTAFETAARHPLVRGFAVGRTIFGDAARAWTRGESADGDTVREMEGRYRTLCEVRDTARQAAADRRCERYVKCDFCWFQR